MVRGRPRGAPRHTVAKRFIRERPSSAGRRRGIPAGCRPRVGSGSSNGVVRGRHQLLASTANRPHDGGRCTPRASLRRIGDGDRLSTLSTRQPGAAPFLVGPWGRRGVERPLPKTSNQLPHLVTGGFAVPFPWGSSGYERAQLTGGSPPRQEKALARAIQVGSEVTRERIHDHVFALARGTLRCAREELNLPRAASESVFH